MEPVDNAPVDSELLTEISVAYYQDGDTQEAIAKKFGLSRVKVGRLLKKAREEGIVEITVKYHPVFSAKLEQQLKERFKLKRALIALDQPDDESQREQVASLASNYLSSQIREGTVVTAGQGRNVAAVAKHVGVVPQKTCIFISGIGGIHGEGSDINADHICRQLAKKYGGNSETLYAPAYVDDKLIKLAFMRNSTVKGSLDRARKSDIALIGVGDLNEKSHLVKLGWFTSQEIIEAKIKSGVVGDIAGYDFINARGEPVDTSMNGRVIGLSIDELRRIPTVIAVASEESKALALLGALRSGVVDVLATSVSNATSILNLDKQMP
ncbi:sugar-binding transcriptional regulator [Thaumasiovibrio subtropicus]|uniref:sugar-binding transcriptional regulator n=1 Tax=Thaumasiovibrio subtropicus TaxID=1891207 RepID=UPI000B3608F1|nr:sugar-binding transcriptional regulator [Thaumasiovibrio subtropicus]